MVIWVLLLCPVYYFINYLFEAASFLFAVEAFASRYIYSSFRSAVITLCSYRQHTCKYICSSFWFAVMNLYQKPTLIQKKIHGSCPLAFPMPSLSKSIILPQGNLSLYKCAADMEAGANQLTLREKPCILWAHKGKEGPVCSYTSNVDTLKP